MSEHQQHGSAAEQLHAINARLRDVGLDIDNATVGSISKPHHRRLHAQFQSFLAEVASLLLIWEAYSRMCLEATDNPQEDTLRTEKQRVLPHVR